MQSSIAFRAVALSLAILLCGAPQMLAQQAAGSTPTQPPAATVPAVQPADAGQNVTPNPDPNQDQPPAAPAQPAPAKPESDQSTPAPVTNPQTGMQTPVPGNVTVDPTQAPLAPVPSDENTAVPQNGTAAPAQTELPNAPSAIQQNGSQASATASTQQGTPTAAKPQQSTQPAPNPVGAATAEGAQTVGGGASKPAGTAIAPAKQNQTRSILIKVGAILGAGAALGTVYALSRGTPSKPPGAQ